MSFIELKNINKSYEDKQVLKNINISIDEGEFVTFLGASGCGKTTLLRCLVGLEKVDSGKIMLAGEDITKFPAKQRGISMIFQQYSLFPTMNLYDNVSFGLRMDHVDKEEINKRVDDVLEIVNLKGHIKKYPYQMSGGEQQRAALARALIMNPKVLLLDEPFSAIDAKLRRELQMYLKQIHKEYNMTSIFVTHDQEEAMRMSDTIHLFNNGTIEQSGSPLEIYSNPRNIYVASFIGSYNIIKKDLFYHLTGENREVAIRPEIIDLSNKEYSKDNKHYYLEGDLIETVLQGSILRKIVKINNELEIKVDGIFSGFKTVDDHKHVYLRIDKNNVVFMN